MSASSKTCTCCRRNLLLGQFASEGKRGHGSTCIPCASDARRLRSPLPALKPDPELIRLSNVTNLWFGPVRREPLRSIA